VCRAVCACFLLHYFFLIKCKALYITEQMQNAVLSGVCLGWNVLICFCYMYVMSYPPWHMCPCLYIYILKHAVSFPFDDGLFYMFMPVIKCLDLFLLHLCDVCIAMCFLLQLLSNSFKSFIYYYCYYFTFSCDCVLRQKLKNVMPILWFFFFFFCK
jgi:hypothetical protein